MSDTPAPSRLPDPDQIRKFFESWWATGSSIVGTLVAALTVLQIPSQVAYAIAVSITVIGLTATVVMFRRESKDRMLKSDASRRILNSAQSSQAAFRGLRRFRKGELLPGLQRRREAAQLFDAITDASFEVGIVTGDSGAGKSSLLECALVEALENSGHPVTIISNFGRIAAAQGAQEAKSLNDISPVLAQIISQTSQPAQRREKPKVIILDQFEELLSRFREAESRIKIGNALRDIVSDHTRIVLGIRKEFLADLKEVVSQLSNPISLQDTFLIRNFEKSEAADIIRECALRDKVEFDDELPELIAEDLCVDGIVRPTDLQIVCTALYGDLSIEKYKSQGRAAGLRSRFVKEIVEVTGDPVLARTLLRALCDIPNNKKVSEPQTTATLVTTARNGPPGPTATENATNVVLEKLTQARLTVRQEQDGEARWSLIHDYLVDPVKIATQEQSTSSEAAAAELEYFLTEVRSGRITTIPLARLRTIRRNAPPALLREARRTILRSLVVGYGRPATLTGVVALGSIILVVLAASERNQWRSIDDPLRHWGESATSGRGFLRATRLGGSAPEILALSDGFGISGRVTTWDLNRGTLIGAREGNFSVIAGNEQIWFYEPASGNLTRWNPASGTTQNYDTPATGRPDGQITISEVRGETLLFNSGRFGNGHYIGSYNLTERAWHVVQQSELYPPVASTGAALSQKDSKFMRVHGVNSGGKTRISAWSIDYSQKILEIDFDSDADILGLVDRPDGSPPFTYLVIRTAEKGIEVIRINHLPATASSTTLRHEVGDSKSAQLPSELKWVVRSRWENNKTGLGFMPAGGRLLAIDFQQTRMVIWPFNPESAQFETPLVSSSPPPEVDIDDAIAWQPAGSTNLSIWMRGRNAPFSVPNMHASPDDKVQVFEDSLLVQRGDGALQLWRINPSANNGELVFTIKPERVTRAFLSDDRKLLLIRQEGGSLLAWSREGMFLGRIATLSGQVEWSTYDASCMRTLIWTDEGLSLDFRRGSVVPILGFLPEGGCPQRPSGSTPS